MALPSKQRFLKINSLLDWYIGLLNPQRQQYKLFSSQSGKLSIISRQRSSFLRVFSFTCFNILSPRYSSFCSHKDSFQCSLDKSAVAFMMSLWMFCWDKKEVKSQVHGIPLHYISSVLPTPPIVYGLVSEVEGVSTVALGCFMTGYVPSPVDLKIKTTTGNAVSTKIFPEVLGTSSTYTSSGQAIVNSIDFMTTSYQCFVEHKATNSQITKDIPKGCASIPLSVQLMQSSCPESDRLGQVQLACHARGLKSEDAQAKWFIDDQEQSVAQSLTMLGSTNNNGISMIFWFNISEGMWNARKEVKCQVKDTKTSKVAEDKIKKCSDSYNCLGINVYLTGPNVEELIVYKKPYVRCRATNIPKSSGYTFSWKYPGANQLDYTIEDPEQNKSGTYSVTSVLAISVEAWNNGVELTCTFTYNELPSPIIVALSKIKGTKITPSIQVIYPSSEELALKETVTVGCLAHRFFPADIYMGWTQNEAEVPKQLYVNTEPTRDIDGQGFFMYSMISVSYENWNEGNQFACVVAHESLPMSITQRTIGKYSGCPHVIHIKEWLNTEEPQEDTWEISATFMSLFILSLVYSITVTLFKVK